MEWLAIFVGAMVNMFFMNQKTIYVVRGKKMLAILANTASTIVYVGIVSNDWIKACLFAMGNAIGMYVSMRLTEKRSKFVPRRYHVTPMLLTEAKAMADELREKGLIVTTGVSFYNKKETLEISVSATNENEKHTIKNSIPTGSIVIADVIKFSAIWE